MLFNSFTFVFFLVIVFTLYYLINRRLQVPLLILSSFVFYAYHNYYLLTLLLVSITINAVTSYSIVHGNKNRRKVNSWIGVSSNLLVLALFKYGGLISVSFFNNNDFGELLISLPLPIGISFFTFQGISLVVDCYKSDHLNEDLKIPKSFIQHFRNTMFFISFFPQLIAGPIVKAHEFLPQIKEKMFNQIDWVFVFKHVVIGYFLKMVVADNLKEFTFWIEYPYFESIDSISLVTMLIGFSFQIFADFAGYSYIAIGLAGLFGFKLNENFNFPYLSKSFQEFWRRWHISLSTFLKEYLYISLGGNKRGKYRTYLNLFVTMVLGGLWHGAAWSYAVWGAFHGGALLIERILMNTVTLPKSKLIVIMKTILVFSLVSFAWLLFKLPDFTHVIGYLKSINNNMSEHVSVDKINGVFLYSSPVVLMHLYVACRDNKGLSFIVRNEYLFYGLMIFLIITNSGVSGSFIYFQF